MIQEIWGLYLFAYQSVSTQSGSDLLGASGLCGILILFLIASLEPLDTPFAIHELLFPRKERMTVRAYFDANLFLRGSRLDHITTGADDFRFVILRMYSFTQFFHLRSSRLVSAKASLLYQLSGGVFKFDTAPVPLCWLDLGAIFG